MNLQRVMNVATPVAVLVLAIAGARSALLQHLRIQALERALAVDANGGPPMHVEADTAVTKFLLGSKSSVFGVRAYTNGETNLAMGDGVSAFLVEAPDAQGNARVTLRSRFAELSLECPVDAAPSIVATSAEGEELWRLPK